MTSKMNIWFTYKLEKTDLHSEGKSSGNLSLPYLKNECLRKKLKYLYKCHTICSWFVSVLFCVFNFGDLKELI